jgi:DNA (cytosine-5)-methyltransferase 1
MENGADLLVAHSLRADGTGRGTAGVNRQAVAAGHIIPILEVGKGNSSHGEGPNGAGFGSDGDPMFTLQSGAQHAVAFESRFARNGRGAPSDFVPPLKAQSGQSGKGDAAPLLQAGMSVRRLTPTECERLQGFPDNWTLIAYRGKPAADGPRYRALGNSMAVPVVRWLLERIAAFEAESTP